MEVGMTSSAGGVTLHRQLTSEDVVHPAGSSGAGAATQVNFQGLLDDWTGESDPARRKRLQNRLNQRAYRKRRREQLNAGRSTTSTALGQPTVSTGLQRAQESNKWPPCRFILPEYHAMVRRWETQLTLEYINGAPSVIHLSVVTQFNVYKALSANNSTLGFGEEWLLYEAVSPFNREGPRSLRDEAAIKSLPPHLRPTTTQLRVTHHPWIDLFPFPKLRDNVILAQDIFDEDALCCDLLSVDLGIQDGACMAGQAGEPPMPDCKRDPRRPTLFVWGDPTNPKNWEASGAFLYKWGWLLDGCDEIKRSTKHWRESRGEERLPLLAELD